MARKGRNASSDAPEDVPADASTEAATHVATDVPDDAAGTAGAPEEGGTAPLPVHDVPTEGLSRELTATAPHAVTSTGPVPAAPADHPPAVPADHPADAYPQPPADPYHRPPPPPHHDPYPARPYPPGARPGARPSPARRAAVLAACALLGVAAGVAAYRWGTGDAAPQKAAPAARSTTAPVPVTATISSLDPKGSGFPKQDGGVWRSQTYASAQFGNLKEGIGLVLDLGSAKSLRAVTFDVRTGPLTVDLRAADDKAPAVDGYRKVGAPVTANGRATLPATSGGSHRYWLLWVTSLGSSGGGFAAAIGSVTAQA